MVDDHLAGTIERLRRRAGYFLLASVRDAELLTGWRRKEMHLAEASQFRCRYRAYEGTFNFARNASLYIGAGGSALLLVDGTPHFGIDAFHRTVDIPAGRHRLRIELTPRGLFGKEVHSSGRFIAISFRCERKYTDIYHKLNALLDTALIREDREMLGALSGAFEELPLLSIDTLAYAVHSDLFSDDFSFADTMERLANTVYRMRASCDDMDAFNAFSSRIEAMFRTYTVTYPCKLLPLAHAHMDLAWLWPVSETAMKARRTFSSVLHLMECYNYIFVQSMAWHYRLLSSSRERTARILFQNIRRKVREGSWVPIGGMMVEPDCNLTSGESLVRQALYGQLYFRENFGSISPIAWLPDTFGFSPQLPQILSQSGFTLFFTTKLSWNDTDRFPHDMFIWKGIDGSSIAAHAHRRTYNSDTTPLDVDETFRLHPDAVQTGIVPIIYGKGDGGGGPTVDMLEQLKLASRGDISGHPMATLDEWLAAVEKKRTALPEFSGELYLEYHRGTYTTHADMKKLNREAEGMLFVAEAHEVMCSLSSGRKGRGFREEWETLLKNQFHDILPGSSIRQVYLDAVEELNMLLKQLRKSVCGAPPQGETVTLFSPYSWPVSLLFRLEGIPEGRNVLLLDGKEYPVFSSGSGRFAFLEFSRGMGFYTFEMEGRKEARRHCREKDITAAGWHVVLSARGIGRLSFSGRDVPVPRFLLFADFPEKFDAWELERFRMESGRELQSAPPEVSEVRNGDAELIEIVQHFDLKPGRMEVRLLLMHDGLARCVFDVDWQGNNRLLRMYFNTGGKECTGEVAYGHIPRVSEGARFEFPAHRFIAVRTVDGLFSLFNDCKYGYSFREGILGVSLLRSPVYPDMEADRGTNTFSFCFGFVKDISECHRKAFKFNVPPAVCSRAGSHNFLTVDGAMLGALKHAEDGDGFIVRIYNPLEHISEFVIHFPLPSFDAEVCDMLERSADQGVHPDVRDGCISGSIRPFGILSVRIRPSSAAGS